MRLQVVEQLLALNHQFYRQFAADFSDSRRTPQPGFAPALTWIGQVDALLDVGCGDARVASLISGQINHYCGVDFSTALLAARPPTGALPTVQLIAADISQPGWAANISHAKFPAAVCFSTLHHLPGATARQTALREMGSLLKPGAQVVVSVWQPLTQPRFINKIVPWETVGLTAEDVEIGDVLLSWERGGQGVRYVHHFELAELQALVSECGFQVVDYYRSDGKTGDLGLYLQMLWGG